MVSLGENLGKTACHVHQPMSINPPLQKIHTGVKEKKTS
jgi:hypothetical protein